MKACWRGQHIASIWKECVNVIVIKLSTRYIKKQGVDHNEKYETGFGDMMWDWWGRVYAALPNEIEALSTLHAPAANTIDYASHFLTSARHWAP